jgi:hypothetical protein
MGLAMTNNKWTDSFLDSMRQIGDPPADAVVQALFEHEQIQSVNELMKLLVRNDMPPPAALPLVIRTYFDETDDLPDWADRALILEAETLFGRYGVLIVLILNCYSLPLTYAMKGVRVLYDTARLYTDPQRRVVETAQMIIDVMRPGGLEPGGHGVRSAQKVRVMHAAVRHLLLARDWNRELGLPINQEDLVGTLLSFSAIVIDGLKKLGIDLTERETAAFLHTWNVVGHIMGVRSELLPANLAEADELVADVIRRQCHPGDESRAMVEALVKLMEYNIPGNLFDGMPVSFIRYFVGDERADSLALPAADWTEKLIRPLRFLNAVTDDAGDEAEVLARVASAFGHCLLEGLLWLERGGERTQFQIPHELRHSWGM